MSAAATYETLTEAGCGVLDSRDDGKLLLRGGEAAGLLDGQLSNDIGALEPGRGCDSALLTGKGRIVAPVRVLRREDGYLLLTERATLQELFDRLRTGGLGWDAELVKQTLELSRIELLGPGTDEVLTAAGYAPPGEPLHSSSADAVRTPYGADLLVAAADETSARSALAEAGALPASEALAEIVRAEHGRPRWGYELDETVMPEETGLVDELVSFTKGCYVGQETVARLHWKGKPNRFLRKLRLDAPGGQGDAITLPDTPDRALGTIGTAVVSPSEGPIALAMVRREAGPGDTVVVADGISATIA